MAINEAFATGQALLASSSTEKMKPGTKVSTSEGKKYRYVKAGAANLVAGYLVQSAAPLANNIGIAPASNQAAGTTGLVVVIGTTEPVTVNQFRGGQLVVSTTPGGGHAYTILGHAATAAGANCTLQLSEKTVAAINTDSTVDLVPSPYVGVIKQPTAKTSATVGVSIYPILAGEYGWIQSGGPAAVMCQGTPAVGDPVTISGSVAGAVAVASIAAQAANTATTVPVVGRLLETGVDGKWKAVHLTIE
ncbi:MAG: hypothetical protein ACOYD0_11900 [Candidatus Nanopelagicales bacterium]